MSRLKIWLFIIVSMVSSIILTLPMLIISLLVFGFGRLIKDDDVSQVGFNMLLAVDQLGNAVLLGDPDETISSRVGRAMLSKKQKWFVGTLHKFIDGLFHFLFGERNHCINAVEANMQFKKEVWSWINP